MERDARAASPLDLNAPLLRDELNGPNLSEHPARSRPVITSVLFFTAALVSVLGPYLWFSPPAVAAVADIIRSATNVLALPSQVAMGWSVLVKIFVLARAFAIPGSWLLAVWTTFLYWTGYWGGLVMRWKRRAAQIRLDVSRRAVHAYETISVPFYKYPFVAFPLVILATVFTFQVATRLYLGSKKARKIAPEYRLKARTFAGSVVESIDNVSQWIALGCIAALGFTQAGSVYNNVTTFLRAFREDTKSKKSEIARTVGLWNARQDKALCAVCGRKYEIAALRRVDLSPHESFGVHVDCEAEAREAVLNMEADFASETLLRTANEPPFIERVTTKLAQVNPVVAFVKANGRILGAVLVASFFFALGVFYLYRIYLKSKFDKWRPKRHGPVEDGPMPARLLSKIKPVFESNKLTMWVNSSGSYTEVNSKNSRIAVWDDTVHKWRAFRASPATLKMLYDQAEDLAVIGPNGDAYRDIIFTRQGMNPNDPTYNREEEEERIRDLVYESADPAKARLEEDLKAARAQVSSLNEALSELKAQLAKIATDRESLSQEYRSKVAYLTDQMSELHAKKDADIQRLIAATDDIKALKQQLKPAAVVPVPVSTPAPEARAVHTCEVCGGPAPAPHQRCKDCVSKREVVKCTCGRLRNPKYEQCGFCHFQNGAPKSFDNWLATAAKPDVKNLPVSVQKKRYDQYCKTKKFLATQPKAEPSKDSTEVKPECCHAGDCPLKLKTSAWENCGTSCGGHHCTHWAQCSPAKPKPVDKLPLVAEAADPKVSPDSTLCLHCDCPLDIGVVRPAQCHTDCDGPACRHAPSCKPRYRPQDFKPEALQLGKGLVRASSPVMALTATLTRKGKEPIVLNGFCTGRFLITAGAKNHLFDGEYAVHTARGDFVVDTAKHIMDRDFENDVCVFALPRTAQFPAVQFEDPQPGQQVTVVGYAPERDGFKVGDRHVQPLPQVAGNVVDLKDGLGQHTVSTVPGMSGAMLCEVGALRCVGMHIGAHPSKKEPNFFTSSVCVTRSLERAKAKYDQDGPKLGF